MAFRQIALRLLVKAALVIIVRQRAVIIAVKMRRKSRGINDLKNGPIALFSSSRVRQRPIWDCKPEGEFRD